MNANELREAAESVAWWLDPANSHARQELRERNEALSMWLDKVEAMVQQRLAQVEQEANIRA